MKYNKQGKAVNCRHSYSLLQKIAGVDLARAVGKKPAARELHIHISMLRTWCKCEEELRGLAAVRGVVASDTLRLKGAGRIPLITTTTEQGLIDWFDIQRDKNSTTKDGPLKINMGHCITKLCQLDNTLTIISRSNLRRRVWRIFHRRRITDRAITHYAQKCRNNTGMIEGWQEYLREKMKIVGIPLSNVANFDQTNVMFCTESKRTLAHIGSKTVSALKGDSTQRCTVMIGATATGEKFPPYIIFKGKDTINGTINRRLKQVDVVRQQQHLQPTQTIDTHLEYPLSNFYAVQDNAWMCSKLVVDWVQKVFRPWALSKQQPTMLIVDEFTGHMTAEVRDAVADCGAFLEFVPGGYTWCLQPMDVGVNRPFKDGIRSAYDAFCIRTDFNSKPRREDVSQWIRDAYDGVRRKHIIKTWRRIGLRDDDVDETDATSTTIETTDGTDTEVDTGGDITEELDFLNLDLNDAPAMTEEEIAADKLYNDDDGADELLS
jgi:hypothetical protein